MTLQQKNVIYSNYHLFSIYLPTILFTIYSDGNDFIMIL